MIQINKRAAAAVALAAGLLAILAVSIYVTDWNNYGDEANDVPFNGVVETDPVTGEETVDHSSLNYELFEKYGPVLLVLGILMFGAMIGGICVAREEVEKDDSN